MSQANKVVYQRSPMLAPLWILLVIDFLGLITDSLQYSLMVTEDILIFCTQSIITTDMSPRGERVVARPNGASDARSRQPLANSHGINTTDTATSSTDPIEHPAPPPQPFVTPQLLQQAVSIPTPPPAPSQRPSTPPRGPILSLDRTFERVERIRHERRTQRYIRRLDRTFRPTSLQFPTDITGYELAQARVDDEGQNPPTPAPRILEELFPSTSSASSSEQGSRPMHLRSAVPFENPSGPMQSSCGQSSAQGRGVTPPD
jgi:hypothetical protein